jgi:DNA-binding response OmpR family regulator
MQDGKSILIVDDEESMRLLLQRILQAIPGLEFTLAGGSEEALRLAAERTYDLILLDLLMPGLDGVEVLTRLRASSANRSTSVIIVSVMADADTRIVCQSLGVRDYVVKPIDRAALIAAVRAQLDPATA